MEQEVLEVIREAYSSNATLSVFIPEEGCVKTGKVGMANSGYILITNGRGGTHYHIHSRCSIVPTVPNKRRIDSPGYLSSKVKPLFILRKKLCTA